MLQLVTDEPKAENRIRELRGVNGLTLAEVADRLGVEPTTVERWESGEEPVPDEAASTLGELLRASVPFVLNRDDRPMTAAEAAEERACLHSLARAVGEATLALPAKSNWRWAFLTIRRHMLESAEAA